MKRYVALVMVLVLVSVIFLTSCTPSGQEDVGIAPEEPSDSTEKPTTEGEGAEEQKVITFWHHEAPEHRVAAFDKLVERFEAEHPNIKVEHELVNWGDAWVKMLAAIEAGNPPDFQFSIPDLTNTAYRSDAILPVTDLVEELDEKYDFFENQIKMYYYDGEYWGVPVNTMLAGFTYRPSYLEKYLGTTEPPKTWDEVLDYAKRITEASNGEVYGIGLSAGKNLLTSELAYAFLASAGGRFFDEKGNVIFNSPETVKTLQFYKDLFQYSPPGSEAWLWGEHEMNMASGTIAMAPYFPSLLLRFDELDSDDYAMTHMPTPNLGGERGSITYPNEIHIFKHAEERGNLEAVKEFVRFALDPKNNALLTYEMEPGCFYPVTKAGVNSEDFWNHPIIKRYEHVNKVAVEVLDYATLYGFEYDSWVNLGIGDITGADILADCVEKVVSGQMTPEEAAEWGHNEMEKMSIPVGGQ